MPARQVFSIFAIVAICCLQQASAISRLTEIPEDFATLRDPLLPTDYVAPSTEPGQQPAQSDTITAQITWPALRLRGVTHVGQQRFIAIIDQIGIVEPGETISLRQGNLVYAWRVDAITAQGITTTRLHVTSFENPEQPVRIMEAPATPTTGAQP